MPRLFPSRSIDSHVAEADSVAFRHRIPNPRTVALGIGLARTAIGAVFFAAPVTALRVVGADSATAARVTWLSRMTAARDAVLGVGTAQAASGRAGAGWLLAGAVSDAVDAAALTQAVRERRAGGIGAVSMIMAAAGTSALGVWAAAGVRRSRLQPAS